MLPASSVSQFEGALVHARLRELALQMSDDGLRQVEVYLRFAKFHDYLTRLGRDSDAEAIGNALEMIIGCCATRWFDHFLTNDEIYAFESGISEADISRICGLIQGISRCWIPCRYVKQGEDLVEVCVMVLEGGAFAREIRVTIERVGGDWKVKAGVDD